MSKTCIKRQNKNCSFFFLSFVDMKKISFIKYEYIVFTNYDNVLRIFLFFDIYSCVVWYRNFIFIKLIFPVFISVKQSPKVHFVSWKYKLNNNNFIFVLYFFTLQERKRKPQRKKWWKVFLDIFFVVVLLTFIKLLYNCFLLCYSLSNPSERYLS